MCLTIDVKVHEKKGMAPFRARDDLFILKIMSEKVEDGAIVVSSPVRIKHTWRIDEPTEKKTLVLKDGNYITGRFDVYSTMKVIHEGYHGYYQVMDYYTYWMNGVPNDPPSGSIKRMRVMKIPKGSLYYMGEWGQVVASQMILTSHTLDSLMKNYVTLPGCYFKTLENNCWEFQNDFILEDALKTV